MFRTIIFLCVIIFCGTISAQNPYYKQDLLLDNYIYDHDIHTLQIYKHGRELSYPIIDLNSSQQIQLSFDKLGDNTDTYHYTIIHCNAHWDTSNLSELDYIDGFIENEITDYQYSFGTQTPYIHFNLLIPNNDLQLRISGNYIILVYKNYNKDNKVLTARFSVVESKIEIEATAKRPTLAQYMDIGHQLDFRIKHVGYNIIDPFSSIQIVISQNNRLDNAIRNLKPTFIHMNELIYDNNHENIFLAGSEFKYFDCKSLNHLSDRVTNIYFDGTTYCFDILTDKQQLFASYSYNQDLNGQYVVHSQSSSNSPTEADYIKAIFTMPADHPFPDGKMYIAGSLANWQYTEYNLMQYNPNTKQYTATLLLKQGYYNYQLAFLPNNSNIADFGTVNGNYYETENNYIIYVYHRQLTERYDKLIGIKYINSLKQY